MNCFQIIHYSVPNKRKALNFLYQTRSCCHELLLNIIAFWVVIPAKKGEKSNNDLMNSSSKATFKEQKFFVSQWIQSVPTVIFEDTYHQEITHILTSVKPNDKKAYLSFALSDTELKIIGGDKCFPQMSTLPIKKHGS